MQLPLKLQVPRIALPLVDLAGAFAILGNASDDQIFLLMESGYLWAWNVGSADARRKEYRFLASAVAGVASLARDQFGSVTALLAEDKFPTRQPSQFSEVLPLILPKHDKPFLSAAECKRALNIRKRHFINLVSSSQLPGSDFRRGPGGSPVISRDELIRFLETRVVGGL